MSEEEMLNKYIELINNGYCCACNELNCIDNFPQKKIANAISNLQQKNQQLKEVIDQIREYVKNSSDMSVVNNYSFPDKPVIDKRAKKDLLQILNKAGETNE